MAGLGIFLAGCSPKKEVHKNIFTGRTEERIILEDIYSREKRVDFSDVYISKKERDIFLSPGISMKHIFNKKTKYTHPHNLENVIDNTLRKGNNAIVQTYSSEYNIPEKRAALMISHIKNMDLLDKKFPGEFEIIACRIKNKEELRYLNRKFKKGYEKNLSTQFYLKKENPNNPVMGIEGVPENKKEMNKLLYGIEGILNSGFNFAKGKYELKK